jgi:hypothetical protein
MGTKLTLQLLQDCMDRKPVLEEMINSALKNNDECQLGRCVRAAISDQLDYEIDKMNETYPEWEGSYTLECYVTLRNQIPSKL